MSVTLLAGWTLQLAALAILFSRLRRGWVRHLGAIFIILAVTYHGLGELLYRLYPEYNTYRLNLTEDQQADFFVPISIAILVLTVVYVAALSEPGQTFQLDTHDLRAYFDWRVMTLISTPLVVWTLAGRGLSGAQADVASGQTLSGGLTGQFFLPVLTLTAVAYVLRFGPRTLLPAMLVEVAVLASVGQRGEVVVAIVLLVYAASRIGTPLPKRGLAAVGFVAVVFFLVLTASRATLGREPFADGAGFTGRVDALVVGTQNITTPQTADALEETAGYRLDGNAFAGLELARINEDRESLGFAPLVNSVTLAVPSAFNPAKLDSALEVRSEKYLAQVQLGLPYRDSLVTQLGGTVGWFGVPGLLVAALLIGLLLGRLDTGLLAGPTPKRLLIGVGALDAFAHYSRAIDTWAVTARGVLVLLFVLWMTQVLRRSAAARRAPGKALQLGRS